MRRDILSVAVLIAFAGTAARARAQDNEGSDSSRHRNYLIPAVELTGFLALLNAYDRAAYANEVEDGRKVFNSTWTTTWDHLREQRWVHDRDPFNINQIGHPYQGALMYGWARSSGLGFWTSLVYSDVGSFAWEMAGETSPPSINDLITTGQAGSLFGETLYRMADLVLKDNGGEVARRLHEYLAMVLAPPTALNRHMFGRRLKIGLPDSAPATAWQIGLGATVDAHARDQLLAATQLRRNASAQFSMSYGLPGTPGYDYTRPLDYFDFQASGLSSGANPIEYVMLRGLLVGRKTGDGNSRGIWGLYGSYDYIAPFLFRVSSTALSLGTTRQYWLTPNLALQGSVLGGVGYGAAGTVPAAPTTPASEVVRDYHFGVTPQSLVALRFIAGDRVTLDVTTRGYYVSGLGSDDTHGSETIFRGNAGFNVRVIGGHTIGAQFVESIRSAKYGTLPDRRLSEGTITVVYSFLGSNHFNAVKWTTR